MPFSSRSERRIVVLLTITLMAAGTLPALPAPARFSIGVELSPGASIPNLLASDETVTLPPATVQPGIEAAIFVDMPVAGRYTLNADIRRTYAGTSDTYRFRQMKAYDSLEVSLGVGRLLIDDTVSVGIASYVGKASYAIKGDGFLYWGMRTWVEFHTPRSNGKPYTAGVKTALAWLHRPEMDGLAIFVGLKLGIRPVEIVAKTVEAKD